MLFCSITIQAIVTAAIVDEGGTIFNKMTKTNAYVNDVEIIGGSMLCVKEAFLKLNEEAAPLHLW